MAAVLTVISLFKWAMLRFIIQCPEQDSNLHILTDTSP